MEIGLYGVKRPKPRRTKTSPEMQITDILSLSRLLYVRSAEDRGIVPETILCAPTVLRTLPTVPNISVLLNYGLLRIQGLQAESPKKGDN